MADINTPPSGAETAISLTLDGVPLLIAAQDLLPRQKKIIPEQIAGRRGDVVAHRLIQMDLGRAKIVPPLNQLFVDRRLNPVLHREPLLERPEL